MVVRFSIPNAFLSLLKCNNNKGFQKPWRTRGTITLHATSRNVESETRRHSQDWAWTILFVYRIFCEDLAHMPTVHVFRYFHHSTFVCLGMRWLSCAWVRFVARPKKGGSSRPPLNECTSVPLRARRQRITNTFWKQHTGQRQFKRISWISKLAVVESLLTL